MLGQFDHQVRSNAWNQWCRYYQLPSGEPAWPEGTVHRDYPGAVIARQDIVTNIGGFVQEPFSAIDFGRAVRDALDAPLAGNDA